MPLNAAGRVVCFFQLPRASGDGEVRRFLAVTTSKESFAWRVDFSPIYTSDSGGERDLIIELDREGSFPLDDNLHLIGAVDPMGWRATLNTGSLDIYTREVLVTLSQSGRLQTWTTNLTRSTRKLVWLSLSAVETGVVNPSLVHGTSERKVAIGISRSLFLLILLLVNESGNQLTIWDTKVSRFSVHEEFSKTFPAQDVIRDLDWTSTPDSQSILAVGFPRRVVLFCQQRSDYLSGGSMWISFMSFDMHKFRPSYARLTLHLGLQTIQYQIRYGLIRGLLSLLQALNFTFLTTTSGNWTLESNCISTSTTILLIQSSMFVVDSMDLCPYIILNFYNRLYSLVSIS